MKKIIVVIDYGLGNIRSAEQSLIKVVEENNIKAEVKIINNSSDVDLATHIVLPGQGSFSACMSGLRNISGMTDKLSENVLMQKKPFLGICVGMQLLANIGYENGEHIGLGWIEGVIKKLPQKNLKLPHMGWNEALIVTKNNELIKNDKIFNYYFVHSYFFDCKFKINEVGLTNYGINFASIISKDNIYGVQFHPEKSSHQGLNILKNFINL